MTTRLLPRASTPLVSRLNYRKDNELYGSARHGRYQMTFSNTRMTTTTRQSTARPVNLRTICETPSVKSSLGGLVPALLPPLNPA